VLLAQDLILRLEPEPVMKITYVMYVTNSHDGNHRAHAHATAINVRNDTNLRKWTTQGQEEFNDEV
jgi:hypothetical protein